MYIVGGEKANGNGYRNYEIYKDSSGVSIYRLQNLPINFAGGSCAAYSESDAMICSSNHYESRDTN